MNARSSVLTVTVAAVALLLGSTAAAADDLRLEIGDRSWEVDRVEPRLEAIREGPGTLAVWLTVGQYEARQALPHGNVTEVSLVRGTPEQHMGYLTIRMKQVYITSYQTSASDFGPDLRLRYRSAKRSGTEDLKSPRGPAAPQGAEKKGHRSEIEILSWSWGETKDSGRVKVRLHWDRGRSGPGRVTFEGDQCLVFFLGAIPGGAAPGRTLPRFEGRTADGATFVLEKARVTRLGSCRGDTRMVEARGWIYHTLPDLEQ